MKKCPNCGKLMQDDVKFCIECGNTMMNAQTVEEAAAAVQEGATDAVYGAQETVTQAAATVQDGAAQAAATVQETAAQTTETVTESVTAPEGTMAGAAFTAQTAVSDTSAQMQGAAQQTGNAAQMTASAWDAQAQAPKKGGKKKVLIPVAIIAAVAAVGGIIAVAGASLFGGRGNKFLRYQAEHFGGRLSAFANPETADGTLSTDLTISASTDNSDINEYLDGTEILLQMDVQQNQILMGIDWSLMGSSVISGAMTMESEKDAMMLGLYFPEITDGYYIMDVDEMLERYGDGSYRFGDMSISASREDQLKSLSKYGTLLNDIITKDNLTEEKKSVRNEYAGGKIDNATVYTFKPSREDMKTFSNAFRETFQEDEIMQEYVRDFIRGNLMADELSYGGYYGVDIDEIEDEVEDRMEDGLDDLCDALEDLGNNLVWTLVMEGKTLRQVSIQYEDRYGDDNTLVYENDGSDGNRHEALYQIDMDGDIMTVMENEYKSSNGRIEGTLEVRNDYYEETAVSVEYDIEPGKRSKIGVPYGEYYFDIDGETVELEVTDGKKNSTDHIITVRMEDSYYGSYMDVTRIEFVINTTPEGSGEWPDEKPIDITDYTDDEMEDLIEEIGEDLEDYMYDLESEFYTLLYGY